MEQSLEKDALYLKIRFPTQEGSVIEKRFKISLNKKPTEILFGLQHLSNKAFPPDRYFLCISSSSVPKFETDKALLAFRNKNSVLKIPPQVQLSKYKALLLKVVRKIFFPLLLNENNLFN